ncbi:MAG: hypothetical protein RBS80_18050 [Thermoguttaceae bacterium]|jgi:hypothetical protein|nr:hypothetical protein [Thermoguttaceae bacterium]
MLKRLSFFTAVVMVLGGGSLWAVDIPPASQPLGQHSSVVTSDGSVRDDELADYVAAAIPRDPDTGKPLVKDVKIFTQGCFGGGLLDDFGRIFGPGGACEGVPWVGGSASAAEEVSWGPSDAGVGDSTTFGDFWTNALAGSMTNPNQRVSDTVGQANATSTTAVSGEETPQLASGNGGSEIKWHEAGTKHRAILFGGDNNRKRHDNDMANIQKQLTELWKSAPPPIQESAIYTSWGGGTTRQDLFDMIDEICEGLDENTQLVLYFTDHGNTEVDLKEQNTPPGALPEEPLEIPFESEPIPFELHDGWLTGLANMAAQPDESPAPTLNLATAVGSPLLESEWDILLNGLFLPLGGDLGGGVARQLPIDWTTLLPGWNTLAFVPTGATAPLMLTHLELASGPINQIEIIPEPGTLMLLSMMCMILLSAKSRRWPRGRTG